MRRLGQILVAVCAFPAAAAAQQSIVYGLVGNDRIVTFDPAAPGTLTSDLPITGLVSGEVLTGIDIRPADGIIYTVATDRNVYRLDFTGSSYAATLMGAVQAFPSGVPIPITGNNFAIDFAPADRIRLISDTDQSLRINPLNGGAAIDGGPADPTGARAFDIIGVAFPDNSPSGALPYGIDGISSFLVRNAGVGLGYVKTNLSGDPFDPLGISLTSQSQVGFDILFAGGVNSAFLSANDNFYSVDLNNGRATLIGALGSQNIRGITLAAVPEPASWAMMLLGFGAIGVAVRRRASGRNFAQLT